MSHPFDSSFAWPFPALLVVVHQVEGGAATSSSLALLDTGADTTLVPLSMLQTVQADELFTSRMRTHWGEWHPVTIHLVDLEIAGQLLPGIEVVADDYEDRIILGRNVLNKFILLLDGPGNQTDLLTQRPQRLQL